VGDGELKTASCKAKARRLQNKLAEDIRRFLGLPEEDVKPALMGEMGMDIKLSEKARAVFPMAVEAKNTETLKIWAAIKQAEDHAEKEGLKPLVAFTRNRHGIYVVLKWEDFLELVTNGK
jgi:hypothetical protein